MKVIKGILLLLVAVILGAVSSTFFMSENFRVSHIHPMKSTKEQIYQQLVTVKNWEHWSYWHGLDPEMIKTYNDIPTGVGASYSWKSKKKDVGSGTYTIERTVDKEYVQSRLVFDGNGYAFSEYIIRIDEKGVHLTSALNMKTRGIFEKLMARIMMKPAMVKAFRISAEQMDQYIQTHPELVPMAAPADSIPAVTQDSLQAAP